MSDYGKETVVIVQIDQPFCSRVYGDGLGSPNVPGGCQAVLGVTGSRKCYNTRFTCQDPSRYNPGTLTLSFSRDQQDLIPHYGLVIPAIQDIDVAAGAINLGGMFESASALGERERVTIKMLDFKWSDLLLDKYRLERPLGLAASGSPPDAFDPYAQGTFWGKWLARNPYHTKFALRVYEGFHGDALVDMRVRHYVIDRIDGPVKGEVTIIAKDIFSLIEEQKAVAPKASRGELASNMTGSPSTFTASPSGIGNTDYDAAGYVQIGDEIIQYTRSGDVFTVVGRGQFGTTQEDHSAEDLIQQVLTYNAMSPHNIAFDLICRFTSLGNVGSPTESPYINKALWDTRAAQITDLFTGRISKPTPVKQLLAELAVQAGFSIWPEVSTGMIEFVALRAGSVSPVVKDREYIIDGSLTLKREIEKRLTQVWVYYGQVNPVEALEESRNYRSRLVTADLEAEDSQHYGSPQIKEIFSRWIPQFGRQTAEHCGERLLAMFRDPPLRVGLSVHASRDGDLQLARYFSLETEDVQSDIGEAEPVALAVIKIKRGENEQAIEAHSVVFDEDMDNGVRKIFIENDSKNLNLRSIHDSLFAAPLGGSPGEVVEVTVLQDVLIGSTSLATPALTTGSWPVGVSLKLINNGRIQGRGGDGGQGAAFSGSSGVSAGAGLAGGTALKAEVPIAVDNLNGKIYGGGGGGGGGGARRLVYTTETLVISYAVGGGGGAPGAGNDAGSIATGGAPSGQSGGQTNGNSSSAASLDSAGSPGAGGEQATFGGIIYGGSGGSAAAPGFAGSSGGASSGGGGAESSIDSVSPGSGGAAGNYIQGNSLVTWLANGDRRGGVS